MGAGAIGRTDAAGVRTLVFERPEKKNAFTGVMYEALAAALDDASRDDTVAVVLLRGAGSAFSAGNDLADFLDAPPDAAAAPVIRFLRALAAFDKPLVAAVEGPAVGIGCTMLLHCDVVVAADTTVLRLPFVHLGLSPEAGSTWLLPRVAGLQRASELLLLGEAFGAERAREAGIVNEVVAAGDLHARAAARAAALARLPRGAVAATRALLRHGWRAEVEAAIDRELPVFAERLASPEARAAFAAFLKR